MDARARDALIDRSTCPRNLLAPAPTSRSRPWLTPTPRSKPRRQGRPVDVIEVVEAPELKQRRWGRIGLMAIVPLLIIAVAGDLT